MEKSKNKRDDKDRNINFDSDVEVDSLKDALWRLTTRVYLLEDFIADRFGIGIGPTGYSKISSESSDSDAPKETPSQQRKRRRAKKITHAEPNAKFAKLQQQKSKIGPKTRSSAPIPQATEIDEIPDETCVIKDEVFSDANVVSDGDIEDVFPLFNESNIDDTGTENVDESALLQEEDDHSGTVEESQDIEFSFASRQSESSQEVPPFRGKRPGAKFSKPWKVLINFESHEEAEHYMKSQKHWSLRHRYTIEEGRKHIYRCNLVKKRAPPCPVSAYVIYYSFCDKATLYVTDAEHVHKIVRKDELPEKMVEVVEDIYASGHVTPKAIRTEILKRGLALPDTFALNYFIERRRKKK